ncbi:hypothetical protein [Lampropedia puyangensis]|uniref:hypothetical protein n=1 Tax=Lampropedia puyangensis TaxID=1330072 RepID=UPI001FCEC503|nr:hypothetical protein [Lampropedia puyangensis]
MNTTDEAALLAAQLLAKRWLPRQHPGIKRALIDADLWLALEQRLAGVGLRLVDNIHADHVSVALVRSAESAVFGETGLSSHNNFDLPRDGVSLLVVLWALIVLPKRERQAARDSEAANNEQNEMFAADRPMPKAANVSPVISYKSLLADFGAQLGKKTRLDTNLKRLENHGFIVRRGDDIAEGPLLDLLLDYDVMAPRILEGTLGDVLHRAKAAELEAAHETPTEEHGDAQAKVQDKVQEDVNDAQADNASPQPTTGEEG